MSCRLCQSDNQRAFESEINLHHPEVHDVKKLPAVVFPMLLVCLDCGFVEARLASDELRVVIEGVKGRIEAEE